MSRVVYLNGDFVHEANAKLSIYDLSIMQAAAAFEMTRSFNGKHFKLREHIERLKESCRLLSIPFSWELDTLEILCHDVSDRNNHGAGEEHRLLIVVSPGCADMYRTLDGVIPHPFLYIADFPLRYTVQGFGTYFTEGVHCVTSQVQQVPDECFPSRAKHRSRLHFHLAQQQAPAGTWPILKNYYGSPVEAPGANLIAAQDGRMVSPNCESLAGISRKTVLELLHPYPVQESQIMWKWPIDELWLTGTPFCMLPVVSLDGQPIGGGTPGPIYKQTLQKWNDLVGLDIAGQIQEWDAQRAWATQH